MIVVFGSINIDQVYQMAVLPKPGETIHGSGYLQVPGGKGANQALAARRSGASVLMVGCVGDDVNAGPALSLMKADNVDLSAVTVGNRPTGCAAIWVGGDAENSIVVVAGANADLKANLVTDQMLREARYLLLQMEVPAEENWALLVRAKAMGVKTMLNLAPVSSIPENALQDLDYLVVNEVEATALAKQHNITGVDSENLARTLASTFNLTCVLTLGGAGVVAADSGKVVQNDSLKIKPVDTTAAGDSFIGGFAAALAEGRSLEDALQFATVTAGLACTVAGAQSSIPYRTKIDEVLQSLL
ncbi:MAG: ribokinase [Sneathiella sp.]|nr:ribokinase [Sneathiella sp.]